MSEKRVDLTYNAAGQYTSISRYEDLAATDLVATTTWGYDGAGRLTSLDHDKDTTSLASYDWTYDDAGRITQFVSADGTTDYTYDDFGQLTAADHTYQTDETYTYDATGNRTMTGYTTGDNNQLLDDGTHDYEYDDEGNRTKKTNSTTGDYEEFGWDHRNRLISVTFRDSQDAKTKEVLYTYDVYDRLIYREVDDDGNGTVDRAEAFVYDGSNVVLVFDITNAWQQRFLHGAAVDQVFMQENVGEILWGLPDNQGTIRDVANYDPIEDESSVLNHREFDAYGNITAESVPDVDFIPAYTGGYFDEDTALLNRWHRWYDAPTGRWLSEDPIGFAAGDANISRYVTNSPTNYTDPSGLEGELYGSNAEYAKWMRESFPVSTRTWQPSRLDRFIAWFGGRKGDGADVAANTYIRGAALLATDIKNMVESTPAYQFATTGDPVALAKLINPTLLGQDMAISIATGFVTNWNNLEDQGLGTQIGITPLATLGELIGVENIASGWEGRTREGRELDGVERVYVGTKGVVQVSATVSAIAQAVPRGGRPPRPTTPNCFVAGTPVVVLTQADESMTTLKRPPLDAETQELDGTAIVLAGIAFGVGLAGYGRLRRRRNLSLPTSGAAQCDATEGNPTSDLKHVPSRSYEQLKPCVPCSDDTQVGSVAVSEESALRTIRATLSRNARRLTLLAPLWLIACSLIAGWLLTRSNLPTAATTPAIAVAESRLAPSQPTLRTRPIEQLRVGQRLPARNPDLADAQRTHKTAVDPATWKLLKLRAETRWADGTRDVHEIETLQPPAWIALHRAKLGGDVPIPLDLVEMGSPADLRAKVVAIEPCPPLAAGPGHVILTTVNHLNNFVFRLTLTDAHGCRETLGVTGYHKFYSESRKAWVNAKDLRQGESLGHFQRAVAVAALKRLPGKHRVYNLTVEHEHVYYVAGLGALVHNQNCGPAVNQPGHLRGDQLPAGHYSPHEVAKRQSSLRRDLGINESPNTPIPDLKPGWEVPGRPPAPPATPKPPKPRHLPGERGDHATPIPPTRR